MNEVAEIGRQRLAIQIHRCREVKINKRSPGKKERRLWGFRIDDDDWKPPEDSALHDVTGSGPPPCPFSVPHRNKHVDV
jgi:hypothetical protein